MIARRSRSLHAPQKRAGRRREAYDTSSMDKGAELENDQLTVAAIGLLAMCLVTVAHEAVGHGGMCLLLGGHIRLLTSSVFRCSLSSGWIDAGGPVMNLVCGLLALIVRKSISPRFLRAGLFLSIVTAVSWFWEGGYTIHAMHRQDGDLYSFARYMLGQVTVAERWIFASLGLALYVFTIFLSSRALLTVASSLQQARATARAAWIAAALGATVAGAFGPDGGDLRDAVLEVGLASVPLLLIPLYRHKTAGALATSAITRSRLLISAAMIVFGLFVATLGHGIRSSF